MKNFIIAFSLFVFGLLMYGLTVRGIPGPIDMKTIPHNLDTVAKPFELSPERGRYILTYSLAERKSFALGKELGTIANPDVGYYKGNYYIYFAPGISVIALPMYYLGKMYGIPQVGAFFTISIFAAFNLALIYILARKVFKTKAIPAVFASLIFGFASTSWSYAITLYQHQVTTFFILSAILACWIIHTSKRYRIFAALYVWIIFGLSLFIDYPNAFLLTPVMAYFLYLFLSVRQEKKVVSLSYSLVPIVTSILFVCLIALHGYYNYVHFDSPTKLSGTLVGFDNLNAKKLAKDSVSEEAISDLANAKTNQSYFKEEDLPRGFGTLILSRDRGIFLYSPIFVLALFGIWFAIKNLTAAHFFILSTIFGNIFLYSSWGDPWGGWAFGPRYLIPSMALLSLYVAYWLNNTKHYYLSRISALGLFAISSAISLLGALTTNQVPPKVEGDFMKLKYNFMLNYEYLQKDISSSYVYNTYIRGLLSVQEFYLMVLGSLMVVAIVVILIIPGFSKNED